MLQHSRCIINVNSQPYHFCHFFFLPVHTGISLAHGYFIAVVPDKGSTILLVVFYKWGGEGLFFFHCHHDEEATGFDYERARSGMPDVLE